MIESEDGHHAVDVKEAKEKGVEEYEDDDDGVLQRNTQKHSETLGNTRKHLQKRSETLRNTQKHSETLRNTRKHLQKYSETLRNTTGTLRNTQKHSETLKQRKSCYVGKN